MLPSEYSGQYHKYSYISPDYNNFSGIKIKHVEIFNCKHIDL